MVNIPDPRYEVGEEGLTGIVRRRGCWGSCMPTGIVYKAAREATYVSGARYQRLATSSQGVHETPLLIAFGGVQLPQSTATP